MPSFIVFLAVLSVLVVVHEFGHYIVARLVGIRVEKFSIGFGPVLFGKKIGDTEYCFSLLPLGGFVKMAGESPEEASGAAWEFNSKSLLQKFAVVFAGPFMNALLALILFSVIFLVGQPTMTSKIGKVLDGTPAKAAGILEGDKVIEVDGKKVGLWEDVLKEIHASQGAMTLKIDRGGKMMDFKIVPKVQESKDIFGKPVKVSFLGVAPSSEVIHIKSGFFQAIAMGWDRLWSMTFTIFASLGMMITGAMPFKESMTGPIGIFFMTQKAAEMGFVYLIYFTGSLSVSLFVLNLLPIPVLDGGHVLFILIEKIKGSPLKDSTKEKMTMVGMIALLGLMAFVMLQDIHRFSILENIKNFIFRKGH